MSKVVGSNVYQYQNAKFAQIAFTMGKKKGAKKAGGDDFW